MAAWPNALFDLCGLCCGHFLMPFWTFFSAVLIGKAGVKVVGQLMFFTALFSKTARVSAVEWLSTTLTRIGIDGSSIGQSVDKMLLGFSTGKSGDSSGRSSLVGIFFQGVIMVLILGFLKSCAEQFAQAKQKEIDDELLLVQKSKKVAIVTRRADSANSTGRKRSNSTKSRKASPVRRSTRRG